jgi:hypothetical protein
LKVKLGFGVEAWGGSGDFGRDAYFHGVLDYPTPGSKGTFVFQAKFVDAANAAGAKSNLLIRGAVAKEANRIKTRISGGDAPPNQYALFTNAPCRHDTRRAIHGLLTGAIADPMASVHIHDGADICAWLDSAPELARSFPTILGFQDLDELLRERMDRVVLERSKMAIEGAVELAKIFVPTQSYYKALEAVGKKHFVVLSGPAEAGKTAIGKMLSLAQLAHGSEVIECRDPEDVINHYDVRRSQCFFADDFFGRTEFDPTRARRWEADLPVVLKKLNEHHVLILTSRAHILHQGERKIDVDSEIQFPKASEVVIDATALTLEERARILYRHAKLYQFNDDIKNAIKSVAWKTTVLPTYTAERVRRLIQEIKKDNLTTSDSILVTAEQSFMNPSERSQKTFQSLPEPHKWYLFSILEEQEDLRPTSTDRQSIYEALCPIDRCIAGDRVEADLVDSFLSAQTRKWSHPSYRDIAIDELTSEPAYRSHFLNHCSINGIKIAISWLGGLHGARNLPLLKTEEDWASLGSRAEILASAGIDVLTVIVSSLSIGIKHGWLAPKDEENLRAIIERIKLISNAHNIVSSYSTEALETFLSLDDGKGIPVDWHAYINYWSKNSLLHLAKNFVPWQMLPGISMLKRINDLADKYHIDITTILSTNSDLDIVYSTMVHQLQTTDLDWDGYDFESRDDAENAANEYSTQQDDINFFVRLAIKTKKQSIAKALLSIDPSFESLGEGLDSYASELPNKGDEPDFERDRPYSAGQSYFGESSLNSLFIDL